MSPLFRAPLFLAITMSLRSSIRSHATSASGAIPTVGHQDDNDWKSKRLSHKCISLNRQQKEKVTGLVDEDRLRNFVNEIMIPRVPETKNHAKVQTFIVNTLEELDWVVVKDMFSAETPYGPKNFTNVIATFPALAMSSGAFQSSRPSSLPRRRLALACHYDSKKFKGFQFKAATDSAVPCAMMLEIASNLHQLLLAKSLRDDLTLELIFLDGEEAFKQWTKDDSIYGAKHLANLWLNTPYPMPSSTTNRLDSLDFLMLLDLIGEAGLVIPNYFHETSKHFERLMKIEKKLAKNGLLVNHCGNCNEYFKSKSVVGNSLYIEDDHIPFLNLKVPILHMIPYPFPYNWHKEGDDGTNLDYPTITNLSKIFSVFVAEYLHLKV